MDKERKDIKLIFSEALEKKTAKEQTAYLDKACGNDINLRKKVEALLKAYDEADDVPEAPIISQSTFDMPPLTEGPGTVIGRYKLLQQIGEGGFGVVYMAEQREPIRRRVALKIIKLGMDTKQVIARFEAERQALALMDHPNIAHVFDAGATDTGRPYFVMELVKGIPITEYCDENNLDTQQRLKLFIDVCKAVQHAHQKGVIHRDIKPTNVLVTLRDDDSPMPKIIDFGIAKATQRPLTEKTLFTEFRQFVGTPQYMSPEQARMGEFDVDTRSDIYSLGVLLYELLTGATPFDAETLRQAGYDEMQRIIREEAPAKPSTKLSTLGESLTDVAKHRRTDPNLLTKLIRGDLDWIVLKTLEKDRTRRYETANELARDIQRHLGDEPVVAGPPSAVYRLRKFVQRNRTSVAVVMSIAAALIIGLALTTIGFIQASRQRDAAKQARTAEAQQRQIAEQAQSAEAQQRQIAEERTEKYRRSLYTNNIAAADIAYRNENASHVRKLLESCPEDLRSWEWDRLNHIQNQALMTLRGHSSVVFGVAISPDGRRIASSSDDKTIKVWDAATGAELMTLRGHGGRVGPVSFSPDGKRIVSGSHDKTVKIWDWTIGKELMTLQVQHKGPGVGGQFSPDGRHILSWGRDNTIKVWDAETGEKLAALRAGEEVTGISPVAFSPDGKRIVSGNTDKIVRVWDWETSDEPMTLRGHDDRVYSVAFSPDGQRIISGGWDGTIKVWDATTGVELMSFYGHGGSIWSVAFNPDGKRIVSVGLDKIIRVWDAATGDELMTLQGHQGRVVEAVFGPDGKRIFSSSLDKTIRVWDTTIDRERFTLRGDEKGVILLAFSPDGRRVVSGDRSGKVKVYDTISGAEIMTLSGHSGWIWSAVFTNDGTRIISSSRDGEIKVWDAVSGAELAAFCDPDGGIWSPALSPDGKTVVFIGDANLKIWDLAAEGGVKTFCKHKTSPTCVAYSPDGKYIVSGDMNGMVKIWDVITGSEVMTLKTNHLWSYMHCIAFSPDGKRIVVGGTELRVWNIETGTEEMALQGHEDWTDSAVFSPDGKRIIAACGGVKIWNASTGAEIFSPVEGKDSWAVAVSPDGKTIAATGVDGKNIILLESAVPTDGYRSRRTAQTARKVVEQLYKKLNSYHNVIDALVTDSTLESSVRQLARQIANARLWEDAEKLDIQGWEVVGSPGGQIEAYRVALGKLEKANRLDPSVDRILGKLGVAQYRVGAYEDALKTLIHVQKMRADDHFQPRPVPLAFMAMTLQQLGRAEEAQAALNRLRVLFEDAKWARSPKSYGLIPFVIEAEKLFAGENTKLYSAWEHIEKQDYEKALRLVKELRSLTDRENVEINKQIKGAVKWLGRSYYNLAESRRRSDTYAQMFAAYEEVIAIDPEHAGALNTLAWLRVICPVDDLRDGVKAVKEAARACELTGWKKYDYLSTLAAAYSEVKDYTAAVKWQKKAIELLSEDEHDEWQANYQQRLKLYESDKSYLMDNRWSFSAGELVAWWKLDEIEGDKVTDSSGNGLDGKLAGSAKTITDPERGNVLSLDGNGYVDCVNNSAFDITASITVAVWIKVNAFDKAHQSIVTRGVSSWWIYREGSTNNLNFACEGLSNDTCTSITGNVNDGKWHHVVGTYDGQKLCLYIDGNINNSVNATGLINLSQENVYIGAINKDVSTEFNGLIDDVRIYSYALSGEEIAAIYAGKGPASAED